MALVDSKAPKAAVPIRARRSSHSTTDPHERWGYVVWAITGAAIVIPELWAAAGNRWWPTISATVGHLEYLWSPVKIIVVALISAGAVQLLRYPPQQNTYPAHPGRAARWRTASGRLTRAENGQVDMLPFAGAYIPAAVIAVAASGVITAGLGGSKFAVGYAIYGVMTVGLLIVPNALAFGWAKDVPFPTLPRTLVNLDGRFHPAVTVVIAGLAVLAVHLVAYPWP
jgi:hypothetical protein